MGKESCSKLNLLTEVGEERCEELCEGYEPCANMNIKDEDLVKEFCSKEKVATGLGYAVCEVMCTTRPCCFYQGNKNCAEEFPSWCPAMDICKKNLAMPAILATYDAKTDSNIVQKVCDGVEYLQEGHISKKNCKEICSERACCFFPGRDNCSNKYEDWCEEFAACRKLDFSENDDDYGDDTVDDQDGDNKKGAGEDNKNADDDDDDFDPEVQAMEKVC